MSLSIELVSVSPRPVDEQAIKALEAIEADWVQTGTITGATADKAIAALVMLRPEGGPR